MWCDVAAPAYVGGLDFQLQPFLLKLCLLANILLSRSRVQHVKNIIVKCHNFYFL